MLFALLLLLTLAILSIPAVVVLVTISSEIDPNDGTHFDDETWF
jgi:hypothetical protein